MEDIEASGIRVVGVKGNLRASSKILELEEEGFQVMALLVRHKPMGRPKSKEVKPTKKALREQAVMAEFHERTRELLTCDSSSLPTEEYRALIYMLKRFGFGHPDDDARVKEYGTSWKFELIVPLSAFNVRSKVEAERAFDTSNLRKVELPAP